MKVLLSVKPKSQLFPIPMVMGCEGVASSMLLNYYYKKIDAITIMKDWPTHIDNPKKGYVGNQFLISFLRHQSIFPNVLAPYLNKFDADLVDGTGTTLYELENILAKKHPVLIYHTKLGQSPVWKTFKIGRNNKKLVSNIHVTLLIGFDEHYYYYIDPLWKQYNKLILPAFWPSKAQIIKIEKIKMAESYNKPGKMCVFKKI